MIIRYGGGNTGIKEYLEDGRKADRHFNRDEMDTRIPIDGDLNLTKAIYDSIEDKGQDRYLHITLSFNEPGVTKETIEAVYQQFKKELTTAYQESEFNAYAEIHWPKIKEAYNHNQEDMEERFPHVHVVIPKRNLTTGGFLNPVGLHERSVKYLDAIQERLNRDHGLSSPRDNPRVGSNHYEEALRRYKDKEFVSKNGATKERIYQAMIERDVRSVADFRALLEEHGEVRVRNEGKDNAYFAVKLEGDSKFTNLKANIFAPAFIEQRMLGLEPITEAQIEKRLDTWRQIQSKEIKYISNASGKVKANYKAMSLPERRAFLQEREAQYVKRYGSDESPHTAPRASISRRAARDYEPGDFGAAGGFAAPGARDLHELSEGHVDYFGEAGSPTAGMFLSDDADDDLQPLSADRDTRLRGDLYGGSRGRELTTPAVEGAPASVVSALLAEHVDQTAEQAERARYKRIRTELDPQHFLAFVQAQYGVDPARHPVSRSKDDSPRLAVGKYNYNVSDFLTKHIGLSWAEASAVLNRLYDEQQRGQIKTPVPKVAHIGRWRTFREEHYPKKLRSYKDERNEIKSAQSLTLKAINRQYFAKRREITLDRNLNRAERHYLRSVAVLEKLQKVEELRQQVRERRVLGNGLTYSALFTSYVFNREEKTVEVLNRLKKQYLEPETDSSNSIGSVGPMVPRSLPGGEEAARRAKLAARFENPASDDKEPPIKMADLRPQMLKDGAVAFVHKDHGKEVFINHPDRLVLSRSAESAEVAVGLVYAAERFGVPLEVKGTAKFKEQVVAAAAEYNMDVTFADDAMNKALSEKRAELGLAPLEPNTIAPNDLSLEQGLPRDVALGRAMWDSKLRELAEIEERWTEIAPTDRGIHAALVAEAEGRHQRIALATEPQQIQAIAEQDIEAFKYLEGSPQQGRLAIAMAGQLKIPAYAAALANQPPKEFALTVDAAKLVASAERDMKPDAAVAMSDEESKAISRVSDELQRVSLGNVSEEETKVLARKHIEALSQLSGPARRHAGTEISDTMRENPAYRTAVRGLAHADTMAIIVAASRVNQQLIEEKEETKAAEFTAPSQQKKKQQKDHDFDM